MHKIWIPCVEFLQTRQFSVSSRGNTVSQCWYVPCHSRWLTLRVLVSSHSTLHPAESSQDNNTLTVIMSQLAAQYEAHYVQDHITRMLPLHSIHALLPTWWTGFTSLTLQPSPHENHKKESSRIWQDLLGQQKQLYSLSDSCGR